MTIQLQPLAVAANMTRGGATCNDLTFSPDSRWLAAVSHDRKVHMYDVHKRKRIWQAKEHTGWVSAAAFSPDGNTLATSAWSRIGNKANGPELFFWDVVKGNVIANVPIPHEDKDDQAFELAYSSDGKFLFAPMRGMVPIDGDPDRMHQYSHVAVIDVAAKKTLRLLSNKHEYTPTIAVSPDNKTLATFVDNEYFELWSYKTGKLLKSMPWKRSVDIAAYWPDGRTIVVWDSKDKSVMLMDPDSGKINRTFKSDIATVYYRATSMRVDATKGIIVVALDQGQILAWHIASGKIAGAWSVEFEKYDRVSRFAISEDLRLYANAGAKTSLYELGL